MEILIFILGLCIGSFLNVCIYRMPLEQSVTKPARSQCPKCKTKIAAYDNIPVLSWILLGGKCRQCKTKISFIYPCIEILTGFSFLGLYMYYGPTTLFSAYAFMIACFIVATFVDFGHRIIPDEISVGGMFFGLIISLFIVPVHEHLFHQLDTGRIVMWIIVGLSILLDYALHFIGPKEDEPDEEDVVYNNRVLIFVFSCLAVDILIMFFASKFGTFTPHILSLDAAIIGALTGGGVLLLMGDFGRLIFRKEAVGGGDVKLVAMIGAFLGWQATILTFFIAPFFGALFGGIQWLINKDNTLPYGPFLVLAAIICMFYQDQIIYWLLYRHELY